MMHDRKNIKLTFRACLSAHPTKYNTQHSMS